MTVYIDIHNGRYRLRLSRRSVVGSRRIFCTGLKATEENYPIVLRLSEYLTDQVKRGIEPSLKVYDLRNIWDRYMEYQKPFLEFTTWDKQYWRIHHFIDDLPSEAPKVVLQILNEKHPRTAKKILYALKRASKYCYENTFISKDAYADLKINGRASRPSIDPFTSIERDNIIKAFEDHYLYSHYQHFVKFLFYTGCRTGEAIALHWEQIEPKSIFIDASYASAYRLRKGTKNHQPRRIPINQQLRAIINNIPKQHPQIVFTHRDKPDYINGTSFPELWKNVLIPLVESGSIERYRKPYNTRHTFISILIENGLSIAKVSKIVGTSTRNILDHYYGIVSTLEIPEI